LNERIKEYDRRIEKTAQQEYPETQRLKVARKLAVLLHRLWGSGEVYEPLRDSQKVMSAAAKRALT